MGNNVKASFSERESEIADLLARGLSEKEIAEKLFISPATVNNHTRNIREKFGLSKNSEIILLYIATRIKSPLTYERLKSLELVLS